MSDAYRARFGELPIPILAGVLPLASARHAEFLHNEVPGVVIPEHARDLLRKAGERASAGESRAGSPAAGVIAWLESQAASPELSAQRKP